MFYKSIYYPNTNIVVFGRSFAAGDAEAKWNIRMYVLENESANPLEGEDF